MYLGYVKKINETGHGATDCCTIRGVKVNLPFRALCFPRLLTAIGDIYDLTV